MSNTHSDTVAFVRDTMLPQQEPPSSSVGAVGWMRTNLFSGWFNTVLTIVSLGFISPFVARVLSMASRSSCPDRCACGVTRTSLTTSSRVPPGTYSMKRTRSARSSSSR